MRAIWKGALSFGLVNIPVQVYVATEEHPLEFDMLHKKDLSPIRYARICKNEEKEVPYEDIVKGFEYEKGEYVVIDEADFALANARKTKTIDIQNFVLLDEVDPIYYERPYYLEPDKKAAKAYALLREALKKSKKIAIANFVFRNKEHIGVVRPYGSLLVLNQLRYKTQVRSPKGLELPLETKFAPKEMDVALQLIDQLSSQFHIEKYKDTYTEELETVIAAKLKGKKVKGKEKAPKITPSSDLMHLLKQSVEKALEETPTSKKSTHRLPGFAKRKTKRK